MMSFCVLIRAFVVDQNLILYHPCHTFLLEVGEGSFKIHFNKISFGAPNGYFIY